MALNITRKQEGELVNFFKKSIEDMEEYYDTRFKVAMENYNNYNSIRSKRFYVGRSNIFVPFSFIVVETIVSKIMNAIYAEPVLAPLVGVGPSDKDREERIRALLHMQQKKQVKLWPKLLDYWRTKAIYGRGYAGMEWRTDYRTVKKTRAVDEAGDEIQDLTEFQAPPGEAIDTEITQVFEGEEVQDTTFPITEGGISDSRKVKVEEFEDRIVEYDCWDFVNFDFFDVLVDPMAPDADIQRAKLVAVRSLVTDEELKSMGNRLDADGEPFFTKFEELPDKGFGDESEWTAARKQLLGLEFQTLQNLRGENQKHELFTIYYDYDFNNDGELDRNALFVLLDRQKLIRAEKNPWWHGRKPMVSGPYVRRPNEFLGMAVLDPIRRIQYEINDKRNQELDYATMSLNLNWVIGDDANIEDDAITLSQNSAIRVDDINAIRQIIYPDLTPIGQRAEAIMEQNVRETTGVTRSVQGISEPGRQTATEFNRLFAQADDRINAVLEAYGQQEWVEMWEMAHSLNQQFLKKSTFVRLTEKEGRGLELFGTEGEVSQADIAMDVDFLVPSFNELTLEANRNQNIVPFMQMVSQLPPDPANVGFFNMFLEKFWVDVLKFPREDLYDDQGNRRLLLQPGAASIFDVEIQPPGPAGGQPGPAPAEEGGGVPEQGGPLAEADQLGELATQLGI